MTNEEIQEFIKEEKYRITRKEWSYLKKEAKKIAEEYGVEFQFHKDGKNTEFQFILDPSFLNLTSTILRTMQYRRIETAYNEKHKELKKKVEDLVNRHEVVYSERELMTDYYGVYRLSHITQAYIDRSTEEKIEEVCAKLREMEGSETSFSHVNYNKLADAYDLPKLSD